MPASQYESYSPDIPHLRLPFSLQGDGSFDYVNQDCIAEIGQCVEVLVGTPVGQRTVVPTYGVADPTFQTIPNTTAILTAITQWEDRAIATVQSTPNGQGTYDVNVNVTNARGTVGA